MTCTELRLVAAELALDELTGTERAAALTHLTSCGQCRALVADLAVAADSLLLLAPSIEPPLGFESRVLAHLTPPPPRPRRWRMVAAAAAIATVAGGVGFALNADDTRPLPAAALLTSADGHPAGSVVLATAPDRMTCVFDDPLLEGAYDVQVVLADGSTAEAGDFNATDTRWAWTVKLPVDARNVREVRVLGEGGMLQASAEFD